jgi:ribosome-associated protein
LKDSIAEKVQKAVAAALDKKAFDLDVLDVSRLTTIGDYFVICSGSNERQTQAIADAVQDTLFTADRTKPRLIEGMNPGRWILVDFGDFVVHVFTEECRRFYSLERLWGDAPMVTEDFTGASAAAHGSAK